MSIHRIDRRPLVERHDPRLTQVDHEAPVTLGNGNFAFTADVTGLQTLYGEYTSPPLCTLSNWCWHTSPNAKGGRYLLDDVKMEEFMSGERKVRYALNVIPGDEECYEWVRKNPHRLNLARVGLALGGKDIPEASIGAIGQRLHMYEGYTDSAFTIGDVACRVKASVDPEHDTLALQVASERLSEDLGVRIAFPYGEYHITASNWDEPERHTTTVFRQTARVLVLKRRLDDDVYFVCIQAQQDVQWLLELEGHIVNVKAGGAALGLTIHFSPGMPGADELAAMACPDRVFENARKWWETFWEEGGAVQLNKSKHPKALELERRIVQSLYIQAANASGNMPPQETGLVCNSWYGKPHGEMFLWHCAHFPLWNHPRLLERNLQWHMKILPAARENAARNGYEGARWPKMADPDGVDGPSFISPILIWQQPHLIYMLRLLYHSSGQDAGTLRRFWPLIKESADFMASFAVKNEKTEKYELREPLLPSEERGKPSEVRNPSFELSYWKFGLQLAIEMAGIAGESIPAKWIEVERGMQLPFMRDGKYLQYETAPKPTDEEKAKGAREIVPIALCGLLPGREVDFPAFKAQYESMINGPGGKMRWGGWLNSYAAMTETRLGLPEEAIDSLLTDKARDSYVGSGYNCLGHAGKGTGMENLPVYLPGNGALLLVIPLMAVGYPGSGDAPGFPKDGQWVVETEGVLGFPF